MGRSRTGRAGGCVVAAAAGSGRRGGHQHSATNNAPPPRRRRAAAVRLRRTHAAGARTLRPPARWLGCCERALRRLRGCGAARVGGRGAACSGYRGAGVTAKHPQLPSRQQTAHTAPHPIHHRGKQSSASQLVVQVEAKNAHKEEGEEAKSRKCISHASTDHTLQRAAEATYTTHRTCAAMVSQSNLWGLHNNNALLKATSVGQHADRSATQLLNCPERRLSNSQGMQLRMTWASKLDSPQKHQWRAGRRLAV